MFADKIVECVAVQRQGRQVGEFLHRNLLVTLGSVDPNCALCRTNGGDQRLSVRRHRDSAFFRCSKGELLGNPIRKSLPPKVKPVPRIGGEVHPAPVGRPGRLGARRRDRSDLLRFRSPRKRNQSTRREGNNFVHFRYKDPFGVRGKIGSMSHIARLLGHTHPVRWPGSRRRSRSSWPFPLPKTAPDEDRPKSKRRHSEVIRMARPLTPAPSTLANPIPPRG